MSKIKAMIAMSGGVDSAVAALLAVRAGYDCTGVTLRLLNSEKLCGDCDYLQNEKDAADVCRQLGISHEVIDLTQEFTEKVVMPFITDYEKGYTPNPCVYCNKHIKFGKMYDIAVERCFDKLITGHYAEIRYGSDDNEYHLFRGLDRKKDQSYFLYGLSQPQLSKIEFPLGRYSKEEVRSMAVEAGLKVYSKHDSQDICFIPDGQYGEFIESFTGKEYSVGEFIKTDGTVLGKHRGIIRYTVGQRKGLGLALPAPLYVKEKDIINNRVILCNNDDLFKRTVKTENINFICNSSNMINGGENSSLRVTAKIRYNHIEQPALLHFEDKRIICEFDEPQRAPAAGQALVFYVGEECIGGGTIVTS